MKINPKILLLATLFIFGSVYLLICIFNHYLFRTYALDLGLYTHALFKYAHLQAADAAMFKLTPEYLLGDHFDLYLLLFAPLIYISGTYTLLIIQVVAILAGGTGIYKYFELIAPENKFIRIAATISFFSFFGIFSAVSFDYHSNVVAAMLIPWFFYFFRKKNLLAAALLLLAVLIAKENMALWMLFICIGLAVEYRKDRRSLTFLSACSLASIIYFLVVIYWLMPLFTSSGTYNGFAYSALGQSPIEALKNLFIHPLDNFQTLFINHTNLPQGDYIKLELHILVLLSGAYLLFLKPHYLIMLIPIYFQKMFHNNIQMWGINGQYAIEFAPILITGAFSAILEFRNRKMEMVLSGLLFAGIVMSTVRVMDRTVVYTNKSRIRFYQAGHYKRTYNAGEVHKQLNQLPKDAKISAISPYVPHLALRNHIYQFPIINDAEYIVYSEKEGKYPLDEEKFSIQIRSLLDTQEWEEFFRDENLVILKRKD